MTAESGAGRRAAFEAARGFPLDPFQVRALDALDAGESVLVAAPTGSGKTVVAEYAVELAIAAGGKADRKSTRLNSSHVVTSRMPSSA